jgi:hypothetical protein
MLILCYVRQCDFRTFIFYGEAYSLPSHWTSVFVTKPNEAPAAVEGSIIAEEYALDHTHCILTFNRPIDDGGYPILG